MSLNILVYTFLFLDIASIILDVREYEKYFWPVGITDFRLSGTERVSKAKLPYDKVIAGYHLYQYLYRLVHRESPNFIHPGLWKRGFLCSGRFCDLPSPPYPDRLFLYGYFQNAEILEPMRDSFSQLFSLKQDTDHENVVKFISKIKPNSVSVSVRVAKKEELQMGERFVYSNKDYYLYAVKRIQEARKEGLQIVVSSNDLSFIKSQRWFEGFDNVLYLEDFTAPEQIEVLKHCRDFVLSNSTFSWWAAFLGSARQNSIVISPRIWFQGEDVLKTKLQFPQMEILTM